MKAVAQSLRGVAASVRIVSLPHGKDATDWIAAGGSPAQLRELVAAAPEYIPPPVAPDAHLVRPPSCPASWTAATPWCVPGSTPTSLKPRGSKTGTPCDLSGRPQGASPRRRTPCGRRRICLARPRPGLAGAGVRPAARRAGAVLQRITSSAGDDVARPRSRLLRHIGPAGRVRSVRPRAERMGGFSSIRLG